MCGEVKEDALGGSLNALSVTEVEEKTLGQGSSRVLVNPTARLFR